jgi:Type II restriction endonuclease EcoO109I
MGALNLSDITQYVEDNIGAFHQKRIESLDKLKLSQILKRKNPYLFKAKYILTTSDLVKGIVDAHISSSEEGIFGEWLEGLAIFINQKVYLGKKSSSKGIDLEFDRDNKRYIVSIKSGPNWGNSSQIVKMIADFKSAKKTLRTSGSNIEVTAINGCCYGIDNQPDKGDYFKYCGQKFWGFISGDEDLFVNIVEPLGHKAKERNDDFLQSYSKKLNKFTTEFATEFCTPDGAIDWDKLVRYNSGY